MGFWLPRVLAALTVLVGLLATPAAPAAPAAPAEQPQARQPATAPGSDPAPQAARSGPRRPNIILISTDDQSVADLRYMPFTRKLIGDAGTRFTDALSPYPLCCPARATLLTGQHAHNHGVLANTPPVGGWEALRDRADKLLPVWLQRAGYRTTFTGKFVNTYPRRDKTAVPPGWDSWNASVMGVYDYNRVEVNEDGTVVSHVGEYQADVTQDATEEAIRDSARTGRPFFIWQSDLAPHGACTYGDDPGCTWGPPVPAERDQGTLADAPFQPGDSESWNERVVVEKPARVADRRRLGDDLTARAKEVHQARIESLQAVDRNVRDTVALLRSKGMLDSTVLMFLSDNGYALGEHRWVGKTLGYEPVLTVPLLMRGPGVPSGNTVDDTVSLVDVPATIAEIAGADPLLRQDGISLRDVAAGRKRGYEAISIEAGPEFDDVPDDTYTYRGVRTRRYTYMEHPATGEVELYDRRVDPAQLVNVAHRPTHAATRRALERKLRLLKDCAGRACYRVSGKVPPPEPPRGEVHPDELAVSARAEQLVTVTAPRTGATRGEAVAWERDGERWVVARGPMPVRLGGGGLGPPGATSADGVTTGLHEPRVGFGTGAEPDGALGYRTLSTGDLDPRGGRPSQAHDVLGFLASSAPTWKEGFGREVSADPDRFERTVVLGDSRPGGGYWSPRLSEWVAGVPGNVDADSLLLHSGSRSARHGWVAMDEEDLTFLLRWADPDEANTTFAVGEPSYLRDTM